MGGRGMGKKGRGYGRGEGDVEERLKNGKEFIGNPCKMCLRPPQRASWPIVIIKQGNKPYM